MTVNRVFSLLLGSAFLLASAGRPVLAKADDPERSPIEFRLVHPEAAPYRDGDLWEDVNPAVLRETQQGLDALRRSPAAAEDPRQSFSSVLRGGLSILPVVGQFANHDWMKGLIVLGTGAGLVTGIALGQQRDNPELTRLGTLGLYPLVLFSMLDAFGTSRQRAHDAATRPTN